MKKFLTTIAAAMLSILAAGNAAAASGGASPSIRLDGSVILRTAPGPSAAYAAPALASGGTVIYSTFGSNPDALYDPFGAMAILGPTNGSNIQSIAAPFTPTADVTLDEIQLALSHVSASNTVQVFLQADKKGLPGRQIGQMKVSNLPAHGTCCTVQAIPGHGYPLKAGQTYWVAVRGLTDTYSAWQMPPDDPAGRTATDIGSGWFISNDFAVAFAVIGH